MPAVRGCVLGCSALLVAACSDDRASAQAGLDETPPQATHVVLLVLDTVRSDHLSCYGYEHPTTPRIDALAAVADRYQSARATAPWTLPSHASMFTGYFPFQHGAQSRLAPNGRISDGQPLKRRHTTLAEVLSAAGYRTGAFVANEGYLSEDYQLDQGFEQYVVRAERAPQLIERALTWIRAEPERPFFLFINLMDAHRPYNTDPLPAERAGQLPAPDPADPNALLDELCAAVLASEAPPDPELARRVITQYDTGIAHADLAVGALVDMLKAAGLYDATLLIVTSDHGEYFGEHDLAEHSKDVYEPALHVPLVIKRPGQREGRVLDRLISLVELPRLVCRTPGVDVEASAAAWETSPTPGGPEAMAELRYTRTSDLNSAYGARFRRERFVLFDGDHKLILSSDGAHELYQLARDPAELENLVQREPERAARLRERLESFMRDRPGPFRNSPPTEFQPAPETLKALRELGYTDGD